MREDANILVIKHGALGDIVLSTGPMAAIRAYHPDAHLTLLTTAPYAKMLGESGYFDEVFIDPRPKWWRIGAWRRLARLLKEGGFDRVYDLQTSKRSSGYKRFFPATAEWVGTAKGASHRHDSSERATQHTLERQRALLALAGIHEVPMPQLDWLKGDISCYTLPKRFALLVPGGSAHRPEKRWGKAGYVALGQWLVAEGITPLLIGTKAEAFLLTEIENAVPHCLNLCERTDFGQVAELARLAALSTGNDTGPMHVIAAAGCPSLVLFSHASDPSLCAPRGENVRILRVERLDSLPVARVIERIGDGMVAVSTIP